MAQGGDPSSSPSGRPRPSGSGGSGPASVAVRYGPSAAARNGFADLVRTRATQAWCRAACELGGGASPLLAATEAAQLGVTLTLADLSAREMELAGPGYTKVVLDVTGDCRRLHGTQDLVVTNMLAEHVRDPAAFHRNVLQILRPGGVALHLFPTLWALPFTLNWALPQGASSRILRLVQPARHLDTDEKKFPAYYRWCHGPTDRQIVRFRSLGYDVMGYEGYIGHSEYYRRFPPAAAMSKALVRHRLGRPRPSLTSFALVELRRPFA
jgi:SAM-dependent methyltransferase